MNTRKKIEAIAIAAMIAISVFSGIILTAALNVNVDSVTEGPETTVTPGQEFTTHYINISTQNPANQTKLHNLTIIDNNNGSNPASYTAFGNISIVNDTGVIVFNNSVTGFPVVVDLENYTVSNNSYENLTINVTVNTSSLVDCKTIMPNVSVYVYEDWDTEKTWNQTGYLYGNDTAEESINVLNATAGTSAAQASPGETFVLVGNVTVDPGDNDNAVNLTNITFRVNTSTTNLTAADILNFTLWNDSDNSETFSASDDTEVSNISSSTDINASFNGLNSIIPAGATNRYFLTMNLSKNIPYANMTYQGFVAAQNITINNGTGPCTATNDFSQLEIKDKITNLTSSVYDAAVLIKANITVSQGSSINTSTVDLAINNTNTSVVTDIIKDGNVVNDGTELANHSLTKGEIRVSMELQEGYYNFSTVYAENDLGGVIANDTTFNGIDFIVNMSGAALNVTPDNPALQDDEVAPRTAEENATINVTVVDKFGHKMVFNESDVNTVPANITLIKKTGTGTVTITKTTTAFFYPNNTKPVQFNVSDTAAETITLQALDEGPEGLASGSASQEFTARIGGVDVYAADGGILADGVDYELVYLQLLDAAETPIPKEGITVGWSIENQSVAGATVDKGTTTNVSGIATLNITSATVSGVTMTITGWEKFTGSNYADSDTVVTSSGEVNNTNSRLYVNDTVAPGATQGTVNTTLNVGVLLKDSSGNLVTGKNVTLTANTSATFVDSTPTSGPDGWANTTIRLPTDVNVTMVRAITGTGNTSLTPPELNQTVNVTSTPDVVTQIGVTPSKSIGLKNVPGTSQQITIQLQDAYGNDNTTATADVLIKTDNPDLGNMTCDTTTVNNNLWCNITAGEGGSGTFTYTVNSSVEGTAHLTVNATDFTGVTDEITITTSGPTGLNLTVNKTLPLVGEPVMATAQLTGAAGDLGIEGVNITFTLRNPDNVLIDTNTTSTDDTGNATYNLTGITTRGTYTIKATNTSYGLSATNTTTYVGNATQIWIAVNETNPAVNETITVYAIFKDAAGYNSSSVDGDNVNFLADDYLFATDDISNGVASATYTQSTAGPVTIDVFFTNATNPYWEGTVPTNSTSVTFGAVAPPGAPSITDFSPVDPTPSDTEGATRTFNITVNQTVEVSWQINGTEVQTNKSVTEASYTNTSAVEGVWNVSAIATNANGTDMQTWIWNVTPKVGITVNITSPADYSNTSCTWVNVTYNYTGDVVGFNVSTDNATWTPNDMNFSYKFTGLPNTVPITLYVRITNTAGQHAYDSITVTSYLGDVDDDGDVDLYDLIPFADAYGSTPAKPNWNEKADFDGDGDVDLYDLIPFADQYGTEYW